MNRAQVEKSIVNTTLIIDAYEKALIEFASNPGLIRYSLDTGQSIINVQRSDVINLQKTLQSYHNQLCTLESRLKGSGVRHVRPAW